VTLSSQRGNGGTVDDVPPLTLIHITDLTVSELAALDGCCYLAEMMPGATGGTPSNLTRLEAILDEQLRDAVKHRQDIVSVWLTQKHAALLSHTVREIRGLRDALDEYLGDEDLDGPVVVASAHRKLLAAILDPMVIA
jgi:hypothetical protein